MRVATAKVVALQNRQLLLAVKLVNAVHGERLSKPDAFDALTLAYQFGLWNARKFNRARELLSRATPAEEEA